MSSFPRTRSDLVALGLLALGGGVADIGAAGWSGPVPAAVVLATAFLGPGLAWQNLRGTLRSGPVSLGLAAAISTGCLITLGLGMNAASVALSRSHWATALAAVVIGLAVAALIRPRRMLFDRELGQDAAATPRRVSIAAICALCAVLAASGGRIAWSSQQHWLARQHYTELYATATTTGELVTVNNHEGNQVSYVARIDAAGQPAAVVRFTLPQGGTWRRTVVVQPSEVTTDRPLLQVELARDGVPGVYRWIRLIRPQPSASAAG
ncbi:MAG TPA: hypothetical protein VG650_08700 [Mycobacteriales bacterium]|nr:hypothetical protein [Mycobacteriales bacterium]